MPLGETTVKYNKALAIMMINTGLTCSISDANDIEGGGGGDDGGGDDGGGGGAGASFGGAMPGNSMFRVDAKEGCCCCCCCFRATPSAVGNENSAANSCITINTGTENL